MNTHTLLAFSWHLEGHWDPDKSPKIWSEEVSILIGVGKAGKAGNQKYNRKVFYAFLVWVKGCGVQPFFCLGSQVMSCSLLLETIQPSRHPWKDLQNFGHPEKGK